MVSPDVVRDYHGKIHLSGCVWAEDPRPTTWEDVEAAASGSYARCCFPEPREDDDEPG